MNKLLFRTVHGSHLYGLAHTTSDTDWYEVWDELPGKAAEQLRFEDVDVHQVGLTEFLRQVQLGFPMALEAMRAGAHAIQVNHLAWVPDSFIPGTAVTVNRYQRGVRDHQLINPTPKRRRHAARLAHDLHDFLTLGRIRPAAFGATEYADIGMYQLGMPALPGAWQH